MANLSYLSPTELHQMDRDLARLMRDRLGVRGDVLSKAYPRAKYMLPRRLRGEMVYLIGVISRANHPKLAGQFNPARVSAAVKDTTAFLKSFDRKRARERLIFGILVTIVVNLSLAFGLAMAVMKWRGLW